MNKVRNEVKTIRYPFSICTVYFFIFFGYGCFYPMIGLYLKEKQFSGLEMGILQSIIPLLLIIVQPMWGILADYSQRPRAILNLTTMVAAGILFLVPMVDQFLWMLIFLFCIPSLSVRLDQLLII